MDSKLDAIIVGGGHNGLTCGAYLARAGVKVLALERRHISGGAAVTEELWPGFKVSPASYYVGLLQPKIILDLELQKHGYKVLTAPPTSFALSNGRFVPLWEDRAQFIAELEKLSPKDAAAYPAYAEHLAKLAPFLRKLLFEIPVDPGSRKLGELKRLAGFVWRFRKLGRGFNDIYNLLTLSAHEYLSRWFENEDVKLLLGFFAGGGGANASPRTPGTAYMLVRSIVRDQTTAAGPSGFAEGGMGAISDAIRRAGEAAGLQVRTDAEVERILVEQGRAVGVRLVGGEELRARIVIANTNAKTTFLKLLAHEQLPEDFLRDIRSIRTHSTVFRVNLALKGLPESPGFERATGIPHPVQMTIAPDGEYMERAYMQAALGEIAQDPFVIVKLPSLVDPSLAPAGHHVMNIFGGHAPYHLAEGDWDSRRAELYETVLRVVATRFPDIRSHILHHQVLTPLDLERIYDLPEGHVHHGEIGADQIFFRRPAVGYADYRSPIAGLYQCGASTHPGGGVTGVPGHNAARVILQDRRHWKAA